MDRSKDQKMLKQEEKEKIARKALKKALEDFHNPIVPDPVITHKKFGASSLRINEETWQMELSIHYDLGLGKKDLLRYYRCLWRIALSYYLICPYNMENSIEIVTSSIAGSDREMGKTIANILIELVIEYSLARRFPKDAFWFRRMREKFRQFPAPRRSVHKIFVLVLEILLEQRFMSKEFHKKISKRERTLAGEISRIIRRGGVLNRGTWSRKAKKIAQLISERKIRGKNNFDEVEDLFPRDMKRRNLFTAFFRKGEQIDENKRTEASKIIYKTAKGEPKVSAASMYSIGSVNSPKEATRYWYRARASEIFRLDVQEKKAEEKVPFKAIPGTWKLSDPIEELDLLLSLSTFPVLIPEQTTKKWRKEEKKVRRGRSFPPDMLIILDSSNSMYYPPTGSFTSYKQRKKREKKMKGLDIEYPYKSKLDIAIVASFAALENAIKRNCRISAINFSGDYERIDWTDRRKEVENVLLQFRGDGTEFPTVAFESLLKGRRTKAVVIIITDSAIYNEEETAHSLSKVAADNYLYLFKIGESKKGRKIIEEVEKSGGRVIQISNLQNLPEIVVKKTKPYFHL